MSVLDTWEWGSFDIQSTDYGGCVKPVNGWIKAPFAVRRDRDGNWTITHLPTGLRLNNIAGYWNNAEDAAEAADFLRTLYNGWHDLRYPIESTEEKIALGTRLREAMIKRFPNIFLCIVEDKGDERCKPIELNHELWSGQ